MDCLQIKVIVFLQNLKTNCFFSGVTIKTCYFEFVGLLAQLMSALHATLGVGGGGVNKGMPDLYISDII